MNGAESILRTLIANGVEFCLANPGTSEMQFVAGLDHVPGMRGVLCLFEGVCSGAADGYARMKRKPAATLLHLGPGLSNGLSNFHNARRARSPVVCIVGQHATQHLKCDAPLTTDIAAIARTVSDWVRVVERPGEMGSAAAETVCAAWQPPGQVAVLIVPADFSWSEAGDPGPAITRPVRAVPPAARIREAASVLRAGEPAALLLSGGVLLVPALEQAGRLAAATGVRVFADRFAARTERGAGRFAPARIPYFPEPAEALLAGLRHLLLVEAQPPVSFFAYPGRRSDLAPRDCELHVLASAEEDGTAALAALAEECGAESARVPACELVRPALPHGAPLTADTIGRTIAALMPEGAILSDEAISSGGPIWEHTIGAAPHDHLPVTGGSIGQGLPVALGAAMACPGRTVIALEADGSALYTLPTLWTIAREGLKVVTIIFANRRYHILDIEMRRAGAGAPGSRANDMIDIGRPDVDFVKLSEGLGVPAARASTTDEFIAHFEAAVSEPGPRLIEAVLIS